VKQKENMRIITQTSATIHWSFDGWATANDLETRDAGFGCWFGDLPSDQLQDDARTVFTFLWQEGWEGQDFQVGIAASYQTQKTV
jgi:glucoamylase